ncbi:MAG: DUF1189 family protein [Chlamydiae bacterium]|nr:DUF1189 family protein [Chlamydiota bacterium]MBI3276631.1 DUF1189 family protein [Chlamydiota bacterium]
MFNSFFLTFQKSCYDLHFYPSFLKRSLKENFSYFLGCATLLSFLALWVQLPLLILQVTEWTDWAVRKLPSFRIEEGGVTLIDTIHRKTDHPQKLFVYDSDDKKFTFAIDLEEKVDSSLYSSALILKKDRLWIKGGGKVRELLYPKDFSLTVSPFTLIQTRDFFLWVLPLFLGVILFLQLTLSKGLEAVFWGTVGFVCLRVLKKSLSWKSCFSIALVSFTPVLLFSFFISALADVNSWSLLVGDALYIFFLVGALRACVKNAVGSRE